MRQELGKEEKDILLVWHERCCKEQEKNDKLSTRIAQLEVSIKERDKKLAVFQNNPKSLATAERNDFIKQIESLRKDNGIYKKDIVSCEEEISNLNKIINSINVEIEELQKINNELKNKNSLLYFWLACSAIIYIIPIIKLFFKYYIQEIKNEKRYLPKWYSKC